MFDTLTASAYIDHVAVQRNEPQPARAGRRLAVAIALAILTSGCHDGAHYPSSTTSARARLALQRLPLVMSGSNAAATKLVSASNREVVWAVTDAADRELLRLVAHIEPETDGCRVTTEVLPAPGGTPPPAAVVDLYRAVAREQVASAMEARPFDNEAIVSEVVQASVAATPEMRRRALNGRAPSGKIENATAAVLAKADN